MGAVALPVPPLAAFQPLGATVICIGVSQAACVKVATNTLEGGPKHELVARILSQVSSSLTYCHSEHLRNGCGL